MVHTVPAAERDLAEVAFAEVRAHVLVVQTGNALEAEVEQGDFDVEGERPEEARMSYQAGAGNLLGEVVLCENQEVVDAALEAGDPASHGEVLCSRYLAEAAAGDPEEARASPGNLAPTETEASRSGKER